MNDGKCRRRGCGSATCVLPRTAQERSDRYPSEALVGLGFRGWISGYQSSDVGCWEEVWRLYSNLLGPKYAEAAVGALAAWSKSVAISARSPISVRPLGACGFCRDECLAMEWFRNRIEARVVIEDWRAHYRTTMTSDRIRACSTQPRRNSAGVAKSVPQPEPRLSRSNWHDKTDQVRASRGYPAHA